MEEVARLRAMIERITDGCYVVRTEAGTLAWIPTASLPCGATFWEGDPVVVIERRAANGNRSVTLESVP